jgi:hypothetical protein
MLAALPRRLRGRMYREVGAIVLERATTTLRAALGHQQNIIIGKIIDIHHCHYYKSDTV